MTTYRLCTLDILDGEVNDVYSTGDTLELPEAPTIIDLCTQLKAIGRMSHIWSEKDVRLEDEGDDYYVCHSYTGPYKGKKVYLLRKEN
jgi:hypothetical protein